jgi:hypothetical protein
MESFRLDERMSHGQRYEDLHRSCGGYEQACGMHEYRLNGCFTMTFFSLLVLCRLQVSPPTRSSMPLQDG